MAIENASGWLPAFRSWLKQWRRTPVDTDWHQAYKLAFRAGWRAAARTLADDLDAERQRTEQERFTRLTLQQNFDTVLKQRNAAEAALRTLGLFPDEATVVEERIMGKRV